MHFIQIKLSPNLKIVMVKGGSGGVGVTRVPGSHKLTSSWRIQKLWKVAEYSVSSARRHLSQVGIYWTTMYLILVASGKGDSLKKIQRCPHHPVWWLWVHTMPSNVCILTVQMYSVHCVQFRVIPQFTQINCKDRWQNNDRQAHCYQHLTNAANRLLNSRIC